jgi:tRNA (cmo5U34)-methyltransferase
VSWLRWRIAGSTPSRSHDRGPACGDRHAIEIPLALREESTALSEWQSAEHASAYLDRAERVPHRSAGEAALLEEIPAGVARILDLGSGDGRLLDLVLRARPQAVGLALDFSPHMLDRLRSRFGASARVEIVAHDLEHPLPALGLFDAVVSSFAIHHVVDERKRQLYEEIWHLLNDGGVFCNLEHVASASAYGHARFLEAMGTRPEDEDASNKLLDVQTQLEWLRAIGFADVDCYWKWRELALLVGRKNL